MKINMVLLLMAVIFMMCSSPEPDMGHLSNSALNFAAAQLQKAVQAISDSTKFPSSTDKNGDWILSKSSRWTSGFFPGCLWYMYDRTGKENWEKTELTNIKASPRNLCPKIF